MKPDIIKLKEHITRLGKIGCIAGEGVNRPSYSGPYHDAVQFVERIMQEAGLKTSRDAVGNLFGKWDGDTHKSVLIGSHIDTVPGGGIFDGCLGVLSAIECVRTLKTSGYRNKFDIEVAAFIEEEGNEVGGLFGSKCFAGIELDDEYYRRMEKHGLSATDVQSARRTPDQIHSYVELHIEQGGILHHENIDIGVVEGIVGIARYRIRVGGQANHAGVTPMYLRDDALVKASPIITRIHSLVREIDRDMVATVGWVHVTPGVNNVIPGCVEMGLELRDKNMSNIENMIRTLKAEYEGRDIQFQNVLYDNETHLDAQIQQITIQACRGLGYSCKSMFSGAGHDAVSLARIAPAGMIFIPSINGISHSKDEDSSWEDIEKGTNVLLQVIMELNKYDR